MTQDPDERVVKVYVDFTGFTHPHINNILDFSLLTPNGATAPTSSNVSSAPPTTPALHHPT